MYGEPLRWDQVYEEERNVLAIDDDPVHALCLSGGGIRSATFCLGVLEALRDAGILDRFHYLSTVSGGGYIGSWLSALRQRPGRPGEPLPDAEARRLPQAVAWLRQYSNYLSPRPGLLSVDTWTLVTTYLRNLMLNWLGLLPLAGLLVLIPLISVVIARIEDQSLLRIQLVLGGGLLLITIALRTAFASLPYSWRELETRPPSVGRLFRGFTLPLAAAGPLLATAWAWWRNTGSPGDPFRLVIGLGVGTSVVAWLAARGRLFFKRPRLLMELIIAVLVGGLGGAVIAWAGTSAAVSPPKDHPQLYALLATPVLLGTYLLLGAIFLAVASTFAARLRDRADSGPPGPEHAELGEEDLEWGARSGAWILILIVVWLAWAGLVSYGPRLLETAFKVWLPAVGGVSGLITVVLGRVAARRAKDDGRLDLGGSLAHVLPSLAAPVFAATLLIVGSVAVQRGLLPWLFDGLAPWLPTDAPSARTFVMTLIGVGLIVAAIVVDYIIDLNAFSLHGVYRSRLTRAYLGATVDERETKQNPFTGTCDEDDLPLYMLRRRRPFPVINMALNLVGGKALAVQERKARSFTMTPLHAGSGPSFNGDPAGDRLGYRRMDGPRPYGGPDGVTLGTAFAISGAAANPNMGYHSSALVTLFLALFNARLGWWLGNPGRPGNASYHRSAPKHGLLALLQEAVGLTDDQRAFIHLSDGGHFENLGLYEMIRRRADLILAVDASADPQRRFTDLGNALRKVRTDFGVNITFPNLPIDAPLVTPATTTLSTAVLTTGTVHYPAIGNVPAKQGTIVYLKPGIGAGDDPADVLAYAREHPAFPHESTVDQWFSESQFESYRTLGHHLGSKVPPLVPSAAGTSAGDLDGFTAL